ncbi:TPA: hypothetical protein ACX6Q6_003566 [Photobacterium damselae]
MNIALRLIASVIVLVSMYLSSVWVSNVADTKTTATVLVCFVLALEAAKACFIILVGQYHAQGKMVRSVAYGCMALILMSMSFGASLSNLSTWQSANTTPTASIKLVDQSIKQLNDGIAAANKAVADGFVTSGTRTLTNLTQQRNELVKERNGMGTDTTEAETMTRYMLVALSVSVEIVSFLCLLAVGHTVQNDKVRPSTGGTGNQAKVKTLVKEPVKAETKIVCLPQQAAVSVPSIRKIKAQYKCGYERAKTIQNSLMLGHTVH